MTAPISITAFAAVQDSWIHDTVLFQALGSVPNTYKKHNPSARYELTTSDTSLSIELCSFDVTQTISVFVNGVFNQFLTASGSFTGVKQTLTATLPAGSKFVEIEEEGVSITGIGSPGCNIQLNPYTPPSNRLVDYGTSIDVGYNAGASFHLGFAQLLRRQAPRFHVLNYSYAGSQFNDDCSTPAGRTALVSALVAAFDGTASNTLYFNRMTNDWGAGFWTPSQYQVALSDLYDKLHVAYPALRIVQQTALPRSSPGEGVAINGFLLSDFRATMFAAAAGRSYVTTVDGTAIPGVTYTDGLHPGTVGHQAYANYLVSTIFGPPAPKTSRPYQTKTNVTSRNSKMYASVASLQDLVTDSGVNCGTWKFTVFGGGTLVVRPVNGPADGSKDVDLGNVTSGTTFTLEISALVSGTATNILVMW